MTLPRVGSEFAGYHIESVIGRGGMAVVYLAEHLKLGRKVALKVLSEELAEDDSFRERFVRESRMAAGMDHPNIIPIFEAGESDGVLYIAMRYVQGDDLETTVAREGTLDPLRTVAMVSQMAGALDAAHARGLVHRDVKPANILIAAGGADSDVGDHVYLTDFGLTKEAVGSTAGLTRTGQFVGTLHYIAPEQIEGRPVDGRVDVYALGAVIYKCLTGKVPFAREAEAAALLASVRDDPPSVTAERPDLPAAVDAVVSRAMAKSPDERFATCRELATALRLALGIPSREIPAPMTMGGSTPTVLAGEGGGTTLTGAPGFPPSDPGQPTIAAMGGTPPGGYGQQPPPGGTPPGGYGQQPPPYGTPPGGYSQPPAPGGYGQPPPKSGGGSGLIIGIIVGVVVLGGIAAWLFLAGPLAKDSEAPATSLQNPPSGQVEAEAVTFTFSSEEGATFECSLTREGEPDTYEACTSPKEYTGLEGGNYTFKVRAKDAEGNVETSVETATFAYVQPFPNTAEADLLTHVPAGVKGVENRNCVRATELNEGADAAITCQTGKQTVTYTHYTEKSPMDVAFNQSAVEHGITTDGNCASTDNRRGTWTIGDVTQGLLMCYLTTDLNGIEWTHDALLIYSVANRTDDVSARRSLNLYNWWVNSGGPTP